MKVTECDATGILYDNGDHGAVAHDVRAPAVDGEVVHLVYNDAYVSGIVLVVVADVEFPTVRAVGIEVVASTVEYEDGAVSVSVGGADG